MRKQHLDEIIHLSNLLEQDVKDEIKREVFIRPRYRKDKDGNVIFNKNYLVTLYPNVHSQGFSGYKKYTRIFKGKIDLESIRQWYDKINNKIHFVESISYVMQVYRKSGLIPKKIARKHSAKFPNYAKDEKELKSLHLAMSKYLTKYAKCPHCQQRGFTETILGWKSDHCEAYYCDIHTQHNWEV